MYGNGGDRGRIEIDRKNGVGEKERLTVYKVKENLQEILIVQVQAYVHFIQPHKTTDCYIFYRYQGSIYKQLQGTQYSHKILYKL